MSNVGTDYIGVGVGAIIVNDEGKFLLGLRGSAARNECNTWEIPGGKVEFGETLEAALKREVLEEIGIHIEVVSLFHVCDHLLPEEGQHWVSPTYICRWKSGVPRILEQEKCSELRWVTIDETEDLPISVVTQHDLAEMRRRLAAGQLLW